ncbi:transporter substrate-binding domain-containing protein [Glutamicibacter sp. V16R2B1]|uniref:transporter substrate-binding domain-containing protein n=1 Tax=Glutamicibacter sp. V16R2B1 TaxID=2036207 RepID=UPI0010FD16AB|nr:transporter substrate-binding domain-containing protein [Glutamicibacter sp. V16R2B1]TLK48744.1 transporter substrate-binding domain-containing protein [Glutamicibacter sp. V16R2B1]
MTSHSKHLRSLTLMGVALLGAATLSACTAEQDSAGNTETSSKTEADRPRLDAIKKANQLKVCTTGDYRPFTYLDPESGEWSGIDIDMAQDLAEELGVEVEFVQTSWKNLMPDFLEKCDMAVGGVSISLERAEQAYFSDATLDEGKTPITLCENVEKYDTVKEINQPGVRSITPIGGTNEKFADEHYPEGEIIRFEDNNAIFDEIIAGRADVMTTDASETRWVAHEKPELCAVHPDKPFNFSQKAYMLPRGDETFRQYVNQWLNMSKNDGTLKQAEKPWFG